MEKMATLLMIDPRRMVSYPEDTVEIGHSSREHECRLRYDVGRGLLEEAMSSWWREDAVAEVEGEEVEGGDQVLRPKANACHFPYQ